MAKSRGSTPGQKRIPRKPESIIALDDFEGSTFEKLLAYLKHKKQFRGYDTLIDDKADERLIAGLARDDKTPERLRSLAFQILLNSTQRFIDHAKVYYGRKFNIDADIIQAAGMEGVRHAITKYNPDFGNEEGKENHHLRFGIYAKNWIVTKIREAVWDAQNPNIPYSSINRMVLLHYRRLEAEARRDNPDAAPDVLDKAILALFRRDLKGAETLTLKQLRDRRDNIFQQEYSIDRPLDAHGEGNTTFADIMPSADPGPAQLVEEEDTSSRTTRLFAAALPLLEERERDIVTQRRLGDTAATLEDLSAKYGVSRERIRQIEGDGLRRLSTMFRHKTVKGWLEQGGPMPDLSALFGAKVRKDRNTQPGLLRVQKGARAGRGSADCLPETT